MPSSSSSSFNWLSDGGDQAANFGEEEFARSWRGTNGLRRERHRQQQRQQRCRLRQGRSTRTPALRMGVAATTGAVDRRDTACMSGGRRPAAHCLPVRGAPRGVLYTVSLPAGGVVDAAGNIFEGSLSHRMLRLPVAPLAPGRFRVSTGAEQILRRAAQRAPISSNRSAEPIRLIHRPTDRSCDRRGRCANESAKVPEAWNADDRTRALSAPGMRAAGPPRARRGRLSGATRPRQVSAVSRPSSRSPSSTEACGRS